MSATKTVTKRSFTFVSEGYVELTRAVFAFFGSESLYYQLIPGVGFCVATSLDGPINISALDEGWSNPTPASQPKITEKAIEWLEGMTEDQRSCFVPKHKRPRGTHEGTRLVGFEARSMRNHTGEYEVLVITPAWV